MSYKIAINASNLHIGGGVQVAVSFLHELSLMSEKELSHIDVYVTKEVAKGLSRLKTNTEVFNNYIVFDNFGLKAFFSGLNKRIGDYDVLFTVFGPNYLRTKAKKEIVGFAQPWIIDFDNPVSKRLSFSERNILRFKFFLQWLFFLRTDKYIVELEHVKEKLVSVKKVEEKRISVVYNTVSSLYLDKSSWGFISIPKANEKLSLGVITRDYPHKNLNILPKVAEILEIKHGLDVHFYTTLNDTEWATKKSVFKKYVSTVGSLSPEQCPSFYKQIDAVVFPSLLECFSATPLEAMVMKKPLFASDRGFVRDVCNKHAIYFDPLDAEDIALKIATYFKSAQDYRVQLELAREHALDFSSAKNRAERYLEIIKQQVKDYNNDI